MFALFYMCVVVITCVITFVDGMDFYVWTLVGAADFLVAQLQGRFLAYGITNSLDVVYPQY
jgi:hypothetical protein